MIEGYSFQSSSPSQFYAFRSPLILLIILRPFKDCLVFQSIAEGGHVESQLIRETLWPKRTTFIFGFIHRSHLFYYLLLGKMEAFEGTWKQIKMDNFDEYLKASGVSFVLRKLAAASTPSVEFRKNVFFLIWVKENIVQDDGTWTFYFYSTVKNGVWTFKVGEESEETTPDGRKFMSTITIENGKLYHNQKAFKVKKPRF